MPSSNFLAFSPSFGMEKKPALEGAINPSPKPYEGPRPETQESLAVPKRVSVGPAKVKIEWSDGHRSVHDNAALREACPCAMCKGEPPAIGLSTVIPLTPAAPKGIAATSFAMVGRYAISFSWSDGHRSGIYPYDYILATCEFTTCVANKSTARVH